MKIFFEIVLLFVFAGAASAAKLPEVTNIPEGVDIDQPRGYIETHNAIESASLRIILDKNLEGLIEGKVCDQCDEIKVKITPATKAYADGVEVHLTKARERLGRFATVIYEVNTKNVTQIRW